MGSLMDVSNPVLPRGEARRVLASLSARGRQSRERAPFLTATRRELCWLRKGGIALMLGVNSYLSLTQLGIDQTRL